MDNESPPPPATFLVPKRQSSTRLTDTHFIRFSPKITLLETDVRKYQFSIYKEYTSRHSEEKVYGVTINNPEALDDFRDFGIDLKIIPMSTLPQPAPIKKPRAPLKESNNMYSGCLVFRNNTLHRATLPEFQKATCYVEIESDKDARSSKVEQLLNYAETTRDSVLFIRPKRTDHFIRLRPDLMSLQEHVKKMFMDRDIDYAIGFLADTDPQFLKFVSTIGKHFYLTKKNIPTVSLFHAKTSVCGKVATYQISLMQSTPIPKFYKAIGKSGTTPIPPLLAALASHPTLPG